GSGKTVLHRVGAEMSRHSDCLYISLSRYGGSATHIPIYEADITDFRVIYRCNREWRDRLGSPMAFNSAMAHRKGKLTGLKPYGDASQ
ncbi:unnamed protein product, partial [Amoebophrya sp. A25]